MPAHFNDLPNEIVLKIVEDLPDSRNESNIRTLRFVSKRLNNLIEGIIFEVFRIEPCRLPAKRTCEAITAEVTSGKATVFRRATRKADVHLDSDHHTEDQIPWLEVVRFLIPTLINLYSVEWNYLPGDRYSSRFIDHFVSSLGSLPTLKELSVVFHSNDSRPNFSLNPISDLLSISIEWKATGVPLALHVVQEVSKLVSRSPDLESFTFSIKPTPSNEENPPASFGDIFGSLASLPPSVCLKLKQIKLFEVSITPADFIAHSRHFKLLEMLEVLSKSGSVLSPTGIASICQWLGRERVKLKHFAVESIHPPEIFQYLSSFSGLEYLELHPIDSDDDSAKLVEQFFSSVIPPHRHTLKYLEIGTHAPTAWTKFNEEQLKQLEGCTSLREIRCWICCETPRGGLTDELIVGSMGLFKFTISPHFETQKKWLQAARRIPQLQNFIFHPTLSYPGVIRGSLQLRTLDPEAARTKDLTKQLIRNFVDLYKHDLKFSLVGFIRY